MEELKFTALERYLIDRARVGDLRKKIQELHKDLICELLRDFNLRLEERGMKRKAFSYYSKKKEILKLLEEAINDLETNERFI